MTYISSIYESTDGLESDSLKEVQRESTQSDDSVMNKITWARRENVSTSVFSEWENAVLKKINDRISKLSKSYTKSSVAKKTLTCPKIKKF